MTATAAAHDAADPEVTASHADAPGRVSDLPWIEDAGKIAPKDARALSKLFFDRLKLLEEGTHEFQHVRNTLIEMNLSLVKFAARRFRNRSSGEMEDVLQVGTIGLIKAIDRFDLSREVEFSTFAIPYVVGEIKRFFRDTSWAVHVPRRLQELRITLVRAREELSVRLEREPTVQELARQLELTEEEIIEGLVASNGYVAGSLDLPGEGGEDSQSRQARALVDVLGEPDAALEIAEDLHILAPLLDRLDDRERKIIEMRFGGDMTQAQIGDALGVSQMQVSRLLNRVLAKLRAGMLTDA